MAKKRLQKWLAFFMAVSMCMGTFSAQILALDSDKTKEHIEGIVIYDKTVDPEIPTEDQVNEEGQAVFKKDGITVVFEEEKPTQEDDASEELPDSTTSTGDQINGGDPSDNKQEDDASEDSTLQIESIKPDDSYFKYNDWDEKLQQEDLRDTTQYAPDGGTKRKVYVFDAEGNPISELGFSYDEENNLVFDSSGEYELYLSGDGLMADNEKFTAVSTDKVYHLGGQMALTDGKGNYYFGYCVDVGTSTQMGWRYTMDDLEDSDYYDEDDAAAIRAIVKNGFWGTSNEPNANGEYEDGSKEKVKQDLKQYITDLMANDESAKLTYTCQDYEPLDPLDQKSETVLKDGTRTYTYEFSRNENGDIVLSCTSEYSYDPSGDGSKSDDRYAAQVEKPVTYEWTLDELLDSITDGEALMATQSAIWSYSNETTDVSLVDAAMPKTDDKNLSDAKAAAKAAGLEKGTPEYEKFVHDYLDTIIDENAESAMRIRLLYTYLTGLTPDYGTNEEGQKVNEIIDDENLVEKMDVKIGKQRGKDKDGNELHDVDLNFSLVLAASNENNDLIATVVVYDEEGNYYSSASARLSGDGSEDNFDLTLPQNKDGSYTLKMQLAEGVEYSFDVQVTGSQELDGVYIYTSESRSGEFFNTKGAVTEADNLTSQTLVGLAKGMREVDASMSFKLSFTVDEDEFNGDDDDDDDITKGDDDDDDDDDIPENDVPQGDKPVDEDPNVEIPEEDTPKAEIPEEDVPLEELPEEDVPLAEVPKTGDASIIWFALSTLSGAGLVGLNLTGKKREDEE